MTRSIIRTVAEHYGMTVATLLSPSRDAQVTRARHMAMYLARELSGESFPDLGMAFNRHHTSIIEACQRVARLVKADTRVARAVDAIRSQLPSPKESPLTLTPPRDIPTSHRIRRRPPSWKPEPLPSKPGRGPQDGRDVKTQPKPSRPEVRLPVASVVLW
jgi:hypothetical protein